MKWLPVCGSNLSVRCKKIFHARAQRLIGDVGYLVSVRDLQRD